MGLSGKKHLEIPELVISPTINKMKRKDVGERPVKAPHGKAL